MNSKTENFLSVINPKYAEEYDLSRVNYISNQDKVKLICPKHGTFHVKAGRMVGDDILCPKCRAAEKMLQKNKANEKNILEYGLPRTLKDEDKEFSANVFKGRNLGHVDIHKEYVGLHFPTSTFYLKNEKISIIILPEKYFSCKETSRDEFIQRINRLRDMMSYFYKYNIECILFNKNHSSICSYKVFNTYEEVNKKLDELIATSRQHKDPITHKLREYFNERDIYVGVVEEYIIEDFPEDNHVNICFSGHNNPVVLPYDVLQDINYIGSSYGYNQMELKQNSIKDDKTLFMYIILKK